MLHRTQTETRARRWLAPRLISLGAGAALMGLTVATPGYAVSAPDSFAELAAKVTPAVVNIATKQTVSESFPNDLELPFPEGSPFEEFFRPFLEQQRRHRSHSMTSLGSGVIIDSTGYIVTNNHVIAGASDIEVTTNDGQEYPAKLIGTDERTDLALLKVDAGKSLPAVSFGDSDKMQIGDWVLAVGNPFGLGGTVTSGIISARGRDLQNGPYDDYLQIDAAINRGNSGGPTFSMDGEIIGINTAIASPNGGSVGIGFAIPSNLAKPIIETLKANGKVERGWLGVAIQEVTPALSEGMGLQVKEGALVSNVQPDSPAAEAGLQSGDVIVAYDGKPVTTPRDLSRNVAATPAGEEAELTLWRDGDEQTVTVEIGELKEQVSSLETPEPVPGDFGGTTETLGASLMSAQDPRAIQSFDLPRGQQGVVIVDIQGDSVLAEQGVTPGDVITKVDGQDVATPRQVSDAISQSKADGKSVVVMLISRDGNDRFVAVPVAQS